MRFTILASLGIPVAILAAALSSKDDGWWSGTGTRQLMSCGQCHQRNPGAGGSLPAINVAVQPSARSLGLGETISVTTSASGGQTRSNRGGFASDVSNSSGALAGRFSMTGPNTKLERSGQAIVHSNPSVRSWTYGYSAPSSPGPLQMYAVAITVDGDGNPDDDDRWAFHGVDDTATQSTPIALYVNAPGVARLGPGCVGPFGNWPVVGAVESPTSPNRNFGLELVGAPTGAAVTLFLGLPAATPLPLDSILVEGCTLNVFPAPLILGVGATTGVPGSKFADGTAVVSIPLPAGLAPGSVFAVQLGIFSADPVAGRTLSLTMTNGLRITTM